MEDKKCYRCKEVKLIELFSLNKAKKDGISSHCKECHKQLRRQHYLNNKEIIIEQVQNYKKSVRAFITELKQSKPCQDCGKIYPYYVMDFDHKHNKKFTISSAPNNRGMNGLIEEINKCDLVCSNCHRERTFKRSAGLL